MAKNKKANRNKRPIDRLAAETLSWWGKSFVFIKKNQVKTWQAVFIIAFIAGMFAAIIMSVSSNWQQKSNAAGKPEKIDRIAPSIPTGLAATPAPGDARSVNLKWNVSSDNPGGSGLKGYKIYRNGQYLKLVVAPSISTGDSNLNCGASYGYAVSAIDNTGNESARSIAINYFTPTCPNPSPPAPPTNVTASPMGCSQISIKWSPSASSNLSYYYVYRNGMKIMSVPATSVNCIDSSASPLNNYLYNVYAVDIYGNPSVSSNTASAVTPACL